MAHHHKHHGKHHNVGGGTWYTAPTKVEKEAEEKGAKHGGHVHKHHKRKYGGRAMGGPSGVKAAPRLDRRARGGKIGKFASGGKTGAEHHPFSTAAKGSDMGRTSKTSATLEEGRHYRFGGEVQKKK